MSNKKQLSKNYNNLLPTIFLLLLPLALILPGISYLNFTSLNEKVQEISDLGWQNLSEIQMKSSARKFIAANFQKALFQSSNTKQIKEKIENFSNKLKLKIEYLIWNSNGNLDFSKYTRNVSKEDLRNVFLLRRKDHQTWNFQNLDKKSFFLLRRVFGNLFYPEAENRSLKIDGTNLSETSFEEDSPLLWLNLNYGDFGLAVFVDKSSIRDTLGLENAILQTNLKNADLFEVHLINKAQIDLAKGDLPEKLIDRLKKSPVFYSKTIEDAKNIFLVSSISEDYYLAAVIDKKCEELSSISSQMNSYKLRVLEVYFILSFLILLIIQFGNRFRIPIKLQFVSLFLASSIIPVVALSGIVVDYLNEFEKNSLLSLQRISSRFLQNIDELSIGQKTHEIRELEKDLQLLLPKLKEKGIEKKSYGKFIKNRNRTATAMFLISSHTSYLGFRKGILKNGKLESSFSWERIRNTDIKQASAILSIGKFFLAELNSEKLSNKALTRLEMIINAMGHEEPEPILHDFYNSVGKLWDWGFGARMFPTYIRLIKNFSSEKIDYILLNSFRPYVLQPDYMKRFYSDFNRNPYGIKILSLPREGMVLPEEALSNKQIMSYFLKLRDSSNGNLEKVIWQDKPHYITGANFQTADYIKVIALIPEELIMDRVNTRKNLFYKLGILVIMVSIGLGLILSGAITKPLYELQRGVNALQKRDFDYRLPDLGQNEFGEISRIFNETIVDMEELQVASLVQDKLIPQLNEPVKCNQLRIFGKTVSLNDLGGDYFDLLEIDQKHLSIVLGDVAGHGVGASLIMAYVKSAILQLKELWGNPLALVNRLNWLLRKTKNKKQKKFMTFQCIVFDSDSNVFEYVNSGHCFPIIVDSNDLSTRFCEMINPPLGTSKAEIKNSQSYHLKSGQALVLYSDGFYETGNIGLDGFQKILVDCFDNNPQTFYQNVTSKIKSVCNETENDDMTLLIITNQANTDQATI